MLLLRLTHIHFLLFVRLSLIRHHVFAITSIKLLTTPKLVKLKRLSVLLTHVFNICQAVKIVNKVKHFFISLVIVERNNGDSIIDLECKTVNTVVNYDDILEIAVSKDAHILDVVAFLGQEAMLAIQTVLDVLVIWVYVIKDCISVHLVACSKDDHLEVLGCFLQTLHDVRTDVDTCIHSFFIWEVNLKNHIWILSLDIINTMDKCFIHVKDHKFFLYKRHKKVKH